MSWTSGRLDHGTLRNQEQRGPDGFGSIPLREKIPESAKRIQAPVIHQSQSPTHQSQSLLCRGGI